MRKSYPILALVAVATLVFCSTAFPWGYASHAYVADQLNKKLGEKNHNEIYASMAPDMFNLSFELPVFDPGGLYYQLHYLVDNVWSQRKTGMEKALGYGFISHNDFWGADFTAHHSGITYGVGQGYVIAKAEELSLADPTLSLLVGDDLAVELCHVFVEYGLDILTKGMDPAIGEKIVTAAMERSPMFSSLLVGAYAQSFAQFLGVSPEYAAGLIILAEAEFQQAMITYGQLMMLDEAELIWVLSEHVASFAEAYMAANGIILPPNVDIVATIAYYMQLGMQLCENDYPVEIQATVDYVDGQMQAHGIGNRQ